MARAVPRYWQGVSDTALPRDDAESAALLERVPSLHQPTACWRLLREWLGGGIRTRRSARGAARRLLSRLVGTGLVLVVRVRLG